MKRRLLAIIATLAMVMTMIPAVAFADADTMPPADANGVITLTEDVALTTTFEVAAGETLTIDLNGHTISGVCNTNYALIHVANTANLTIKDSASGGKITYASGTRNAGVTVWSEGNLTLESGTIEVTGTWSEVGIAVDLRPNSWEPAYTKGASFVMNGGEISSSSIGVRVSDNSGTTERFPIDFTMNAGKITGTWAVYVQKLSETRFTDDLGVTINDGTLTATSTTNPLAIYVYNTTAGQTTVDIKGGTFNGDVAFYTNATLPTGNVSITDGEFKSEYGLYTWDNYTYGFKVISGGTFVAEPDPYYLTTDVKKIKNEDGTYEVVCAHTAGTEKGSKDATCTEPGYKDADICKKCGEIVTAGETIEATGEHNYVDGVCTMCKNPEPVTPENPTGPTNPGGSTDTEIEPSNPTDSDEGTTEQESEEDDTATEEPSDKDDADDAVKTNDTSNMTVPFALAGLAVLAMAAVVLTRRQRQN